MNFETGFVIFLYILLGAALAWFIYGQGWKQVLPLISSYKEQQLLQARFTLEKMAYHGLVSALVSQVRASGVSGSSVYQEWREVQSNLKDHGLFSLLESAMEELHSQVQSSDQNKADGLKFIKDDEGLFTIVVDPIQYWIVSKVDRRAGNTEKASSLDELQETLDEDQPICLVYRGEKTSRYGTVKELVEQIRSEGK